MTLYSPDDQLVIIDNWSLSVTGPELGPDGWSILAGTGPATARSGLQTFTLPRAGPLVYTHQDQAGSSRARQTRPVRTERN